MNNNMSRSARMVALASQEAKKIQYENAHINNQHPRTVAEYLDTDIQNEQSGLHVRSSDFPLPEIAQNHKSNINDGELDEEVICEDDPFENNDDSDVDPNYMPSPNQSDDDEEMEFLAEQIERNLEESSNQENVTAEVTNANGSNQKPSSSKMYLKQIKLKRNSGQSYISSSGRSVNSLECKPLDKCRKDCQTKMSYDQQKTIFDQYWNLKSYNLRSAFLSGLIEIQNKKFQTLQKKSLKVRNYSCYYFVKVSTDKISLCKNCFKKTFGETDGIIRTVANKKFHSPGSSIPSNNRGARIPLDLTSNEKINEIKAHGNSFPSYESHYTRRDTSKRYFHSDLTITKMFQLYIEKVEKPVSLTKFSEVFHTIGIKFKSPKTDTCHKCDTFAAKITVAENEDKTQVIVEEQRKHHALADEAYKSKQRDKVLAASDPTETKIFAFDLQQCLPTPNVMTSVSFYKRLLWTYNLTVHDCYSSASNCYMWSEVTGQRDGNEIASCLLTHLNALPNTAKHIIFYSDCCTGQNRNSFVGTMFYTYMQDNPQSNLQFIDHKFLVPDHTHMECDSDHAAIERKKKRSSVKIHEPRDWFQFVHSVATRFFVHEMAQDHIYDFAALAKSKLMWRKVNTNGEKFEWSDIKWVRYTKDQGQIFYKTTYNEDEPFKILNITRRGFNNLTRHDLALCYKSQLKISDAKKQDLLDLLPLLDPSVHDFYSNINTEPHLDTHPDLTEDDDC